MRSVKVITLFLVVAVLSALALAAEEGVAASDFHKNDITYSNEVATPHVKWAEKLPGGPIKGFFIPSIEYGSDMVELMHRLSLEPTTVSIDRNWDTNCWGIGDFYGHQYRGDRDDFRIVFGYVEKDLTGPAEFEVMVIPGLNGWSRMTRATRDAILKRVEEGAGLVLIHPFVGDVKGHPFAADPIEMRGNESASGDETPIKAYETEEDMRLWEISPLVDCLNDTVSEKGYPVINRDALAKGAWRPGEKHFITSGVPLELLPEGSIGGNFYKYRAAGDATVIIKSGEYPIAAVKTFGKGRVIAFAYREEGFIPQDIDSVEEKISWNFHEYWYSLLSRSIVWAAGRDSGVSMDDVAASCGNGAALEMTLASDSPRDVSIEIAGRSEFGQEIGSYTLARSLIKGENRVSVASEELEPEAGWGGGRQIIDVIVKDASGATLNWGTATFETTAPAMVENVRMSSEYYKNGETLSAVVLTGGNFEGLTTRVKITDDLDRLLAVLESPARQEKYFTWHIRNFLGKYAFVTVELVNKRGALLDAIRVKPVLVLNQTRREKEFRALLSFGGGRSWLTNIRTKIIRDAGAETGFTWGGGVNNGLNIPRGTFGVYWYDRGPTTPEGIQKRVEQFERDGDFESLPYLTRKELYRRTGDKKFLSRVPCFHDPDTRKLLYDIVHATARSKAGYNLDYYFVGDEGSLSSYTDTVDFCWSEHTLAEFRKWLAAEYGSLDNLNASWKTSFETWDAVAPLTTDEALRTGNFPPWADHRTFMEVTFAGAYELVRDAVVAGDPEGHIAVSGTQAPMAYNGCDWYRLDQVIDDFLSYGGGNQWDLHRSFAKPGSMIGYWTGYGSSGLGVQNAIWTAAIHNVLHPNIFWLSSYLNPDLTLSKSARDMGVAFKALKFEGVGKLLMESERLNDGIALHYSMPSIHAATITFNHRLRGRRNVNRDFESNRDGWVRLVKEMGMQFDFVSYDQVEKGKLASGDYKVFVLPMSMALSLEEVEEIRKFVADGGVVIADAAAGVMDDHCAWAEDGSLNDLFGIAAGPSSSRTLANPAEIATDDEGEMNITVTKSPTASGEIAVTEKGAAWGLEAEALAGIVAVEPDLKAAAGTALVKIGDTDVAIVNRVGKGTAVYLNCLLDGVFRGRRRRRGGPPPDERPRHAYQALLKGVLAHVGVNPVVEVLTENGEAVTNAQIARYKFGDSYVVAMVKALTGIEGLDGVTYYDDANLGRVARQTVTVGLPQKFYVSDVRTGNRLGYTDSVKTSVTVGGAMILGLSPADQSLTLTGPSQAALGEYPEFTISAANPGKALVRCHFFGPDGEFIAAYAKNVIVEGGKGTVALPSALSDAPGRYTVKVTDVVTGATTEAKINLK